VKLSKSARCSTVDPAAGELLALVPFRVALFAAYLCSVRQHPGAIRVLSRTFGLSHGATSVSSDRVRIEALAS